MSAPASPPAREAPSGAPTSPARPPAHGDAFALARIAIGVLLAGVGPSVLWSLASGVGPSVLWSLASGVGPSGLWSLASGVAGAADAPGLEGGAADGVRVAAGLAAIPGVLVALGVARRTAAGAALALFAGALGLAIAGRASPATWLAPGAWSVVSAALVWAPSGEELRWRGRAARAVRWRWPAGAVPLLWGALVGVYLLDVAAGGPERWLGPALALACALPPTRRAGWTAGVAASLALTVLGIEPWLHTATLSLHLLVLDESWWPPAAPSDPHPVIFFDGVCGLCNRSVDWVIRRDPGGIFLFAPLQWDTAKAALGEERASALDGVILRDGDGLHEGSTAVLRILGRLGGVWRPVSALRVVPRPLRDLVYRAVARRRYAWFGVRDECRIPTPAERTRFLA